MPSTTRGRHAQAPYSPRHARPSQAPVRLATATAVGGCLLPLTSLGVAHADERQASAVRISGPGHAVQPGAVKVAVRLLSDGQWVRNGTVQIQEPAGGNGWQTIARANTGSDGLAHTSVSLQHSTPLRAYYPGSASRTTAQSKSLMIDVESWGQRVVAEAARHRGAPYRYGAAGPSAFDCSGFTRYVFGQLGRSLPHNAQAQENVAQPISRSAALPGDLVFLDGASHVGIYAGNGQMWDAPRSGESVTLRAIYTNNYRVGRVA